MSWRTEKGPPPWARVRRLAQVVPEVKELTGPLDAPAALDPETARLRLFEAVASLLQALGRRRGIAVVLDDLQWADVASLGLVSFLALRLRALPVVLVATYRPAEVGPGHPLTDPLAALARHQVAIRLDLAGLGPSEVKALVEATTGQSTSTEVVATVVARTESNHFFVAELVRLLAAEGGSGPEAVATALPAGVRDVLRRRLGRLPEQTTAVLSLAALAGREFDLDMLETAADFDPERTLELVEAALMSGLVVEHSEAVGRFRFSHDLVRETVAGELTALRQARLHARLAKALEDVPLPGLVAPGRPDGARQLTHETVELAQEMGDPVSLSHALDFLAWIHTLDRDIPTAEAAAARALEFARDKGFPLYVGLKGVLHGWARAHRGQVEAGITEIEEGLRTMERAGSWMLHTHAYSLLAEAHQRAGRPEDALAWVERAMELLEPTGEPFWEAELHRLRGELLLELSPDRAGEAESEFRTALAVARAQGAKSLEERAAESLARLAGRS